MKTTLIALLALVVAAGCGKKEPKLSTEKSEEMRKSRAKLLLWEFETGGWVSSSPAIGSDGTVYVGSYDKKLYAIKTDSKGLAKSPWPMRGQNPMTLGHLSALKTDW